MLNLRRASSPSLRRTEDFRTLVSIKGNTFSENNTDGVRCSSQLRRPSSETVVVRQKLIAQILFSREA